MNMISRLTPGLWYPLSTLHERRCRRPCKTDFRLAGCAFAGRELNPLDRTERFQATSILLSRIYPDASWAHARRPFYEFYTSSQSPLAAEVLARIANLYAIEADIRGQPPDVRHAVRQVRSRPLVEDLHLWLQDRLPRVPGWSDLAKAMRYVLRHWDGLSLYLDDGRLEMDTNVVERAIRPVTITRMNSLFAGSDAGARRWAIASTLIQTCKLSGIDPLAWLTDVLQRIVSGQTKNHELHTLLPWNWRQPSTVAAT
jgi:transposase